MDYDETKMNLEIEKNNIPATANQNHSDAFKSVGSASCGQFTIAEPDGRLVRQTASLLSASLASLAPKRPTDLSISPHEQRILRILTSPTIERASDGKVKAKASMEGAVSTLPDDVRDADDSPAIRRETSMPSIMATAVVDSWRKGNRSRLTTPNQSSNFRDDLQKIKRLLLTSRKCTSVKVDAVAEAALPSPTRLLGDIRGESASDDSLTRGDDLSLKDYHLSNLSHEVLMQIICRFPFANLPKKTLSRTLSNEVSSRYDGAHERQSKKPPKTPSTPLTDTPPLDSPNGSPWNLKKRFLSRHYPTTVEAQRPVDSALGNVNCDDSSLRQKMPRSKAKQLMRSESNSNASDFKTSALGKLCKVSVDTMAITALPLDCWLKERLKNWVQLSGHAGTIVPASNHTLWKKLPNQNTTEAVAYAKISADPALAGLTPKFYKEITHKNESFIEIQDLLARFPNTSSRAIMDIKMGVRTFLESEVSNTTKRTDLYKKMIDIDPNEPTEQERADEAITKLRYMQFRERESSTASLGFRIEAAQLPGGKLQKSFKKVHTKVQVMNTLVHFFGERHVEICTQLVTRLRAMRDGIQKSRFFGTHEVVGSSILIVYDDTKTGAWMIDFAKSTTVPESITVNHRVPWTMGNHEDGYLIGLGNLIDILETAEKESRKTNVLTTVNK